MVQRVCWFLFSWSWKTSSLTEYLDPCQTVMNKNDSLGLGKGGNNFSNILVTSLPHGGMQISGEPDQFVTNLYPLSMKQIGILKVMLAVGITHTKAHTCPKGYRPGSSWKQKHAGTYIYHLLYSLVKMELFLIKYIYIFLVCALFICTCSFMNKWTTYNNYAHIYNFNPQKPQTRSRRSKKYSKIHENQPLEISLTVFFFFPLSDHNHQVDYFCLLWCMLGMFVLP